MPTPSLQRQRVPEGVNPIEFSARWRVRGYELDSNGHVNNAVYLNWAEEIATQHAEAAGYGREWSIAHGGGWVVRRSEIVHHRPAVFGDEVDVSVKVDLVKGARAVRRTAISRVADGQILADVLTEWVLVRLIDGRATYAPRVIVESAVDVTTAFLVRRLHTASSPRTRA